MNCFQASHMCSHPNVYIYRRWSHSTEIYISDFQKSEKLELQSTCLHHCFPLINRGRFLKCFLWWDLSSFQDLLNVGFFMKVLVGLRVGLTATWCFKIPVTALLIWVFLSTEPSFLAIHLNNFQDFTTLSAERTLQTEPLLFLSRRWLNRYLPFC